MRSRTRRTAAPAKPMDMDALFDTSSRASDVGEAMLVQVARSWIVSVGMLAAFGAVLFVTA